MKFKILYEDGDGIYYGNEIVEVNNFVEAHNIATKNAKAIFRAVRSINQI